jgi:trehalose 2-sulfotransferase
VDRGTFQAYLVCATPRSGSTLLCEMLRDTGLAGRPLEHFEVLRHSSLPRQPHEYFGDVDLDGLDELLPEPRPGTPSQESPKAWLARILSDGRGENGVWGGKLMWGHVDDLVTRARRLPGLADADLEQVLRALFDDPQLILVTRRDKVAQAVSLWRAVQTQSWRADDAGKDEAPVYEFAAIDHLVSQLESDERSWKEWLAQTDQRPFVVTYEQLEAAPAETVSSVLHALGLPDAGVSVPRLSRQRDELSEAWVERYRHERGEAA